MAKNRLVSLCTSWSLRYPPCLISLITNKLAANSVTIADFIVIPTCFFSRREVEKWSTLRTRFFFVCWRFKRPFFFCKARDYWRTWAAGKHGTKNNAISFWNKSTLSSKFGVIFDVDTIFFLGCSTLSTRTYLLVTQEWKKQLVVATYGFVYVAFIFQGSYSLINIAI